MVTVKEAMVALMINFNDGRDWDDGNDVKYGDKDYT